jgi:hypothetical protein
MKLSTLAAKIKGLKKHVNDVMANPHTKWTLRRIIPIILREYVFSKYPHILMCVTRTTELTTLYIK